MTWKQAKLTHVAGERLSQRGKLAPVERAALAYARWQGLTDEDGIDTVAAKRALDTALDELDEMGPLGWKGLAQLADELGDPAIIGLMRHSLQRGSEHVRDAAADKGITAASTADPRPRKKKTLDR